MSMRPVVTHSTMWVDNPSTIASRAAGSSFLKRSIKGSVSWRPMLGGSPMVTRPTGSSRLAPRASRACAISCSTATLWSNRRLPASVSVTPRPLRRNNCWCNSVSRPRTCRLSAGCAMSSTTAALLKLPSSATCTKYSSCLRFMAQSDQDEIGFKSTRRDQDMAPLLLRNSGLLDHLLPLVDIGLQPGRYLLGGRGPGLYAKLEQPLLHLRLGEDVLQRLIEYLDDFRRRTRRGKQRVPGDNVVVGHAGFPQGGNIRRAFRAYRPRRRQRPDFPFGEIPLHGRVAVDHQGDVALHGGHQQFRRSAIGNDGEIDAGSRLEQLRRQILRASDID